MAKVKLQQIKLSHGEVAAQPPFPGGWVLAVFDAMRVFAPALAAEHQLPISPRTQERIKAAEAVKQRCYDEIEGKLVELVTALFPKVAVVNGFAKKYVDEYFRLWKQAAEWSPQMAKCLGFEPGESSVLGRALVRDLILRLCYLESCEGRLTGKTFGEPELALLRHDSPAQVYQVLISEQARLQRVSQEELAERLATNEKWLGRVKRGVSVPGIKLLLALKPREVGQRLLAGIGFIDHLLKTLGRDASGLRTELLAIASVFFRNHPAALEDFIGYIPFRTDSGAIRYERHDFKEYITFGDHLLLHAGFQDIYPEMPDALWRAHLYTLQFARNGDLAQAYFQYSKEEGDQALESMLAKAEHDSCGSAHAWMDRLRERSKGQGRRQ